MARETITLVLDGTVIGWWRVWIPGAQSRSVVRADTQRKIDKLWLPPSPIKSVEMDQGIAWIARNMMRTAMAATKKLKPMDAIHLATAKRCGVVEIHTYDPDWPPFANEIGLVMRQPHCEHLSARPDNAGDDTKD